MHTSPAMPPSHRNMMLVIRQWGAFLVRQTCLLLMKSPWSARRVSVSRSFRPWHLSKSRLLCKAWSASPRPSGSAFGFCLGGSVSSSLICGLRKAARVHSTESSCSYNAWASGDQSLRRFGASEGVPEIECNDQPANSHLLVLKLMATCHPYRR